MIPCRVLIFFKFQLRIGLVVFGFSSFGPSFGGGGRAGEGGIWGGDPGLAAASGHLPLLCVLVCWCMLVYGAECCAPSACTWGPVAHGAAGLLVYGNSTAAFGFDNPAVLAEGVV